MVDTVSRLADLVRGRKGTISALALAAAIAVPVAVAVTHHGFPITTAELDPRTVWVSNAESALAGRLSKPIKELNGAVQPKSAFFDLLQDGNGVFVYNVEGATLSRLDPAFNTLEGETKVSPGVVASYGAGVIALVRPTDGALWIMLGNQPLDGAADPVMELGKDGLAVVTDAGTVIAYSAAEGTLYSIPSGGGDIAETRIIAPPGDLELTAVGEKAVLLAQGTTTLILPGGNEYKLPEEGYRLQQAGPDDDSVLVAGGDSLLEVPLGGGETEAVDAGGSVAATTPRDVSAPVRLGDCVYGAWAVAQREVHRCGDGDSIGNDIAGVAAGDELVFRVNRSVIVLNNIRNGDSWVIERELTLVSNWDDVTPEAAEQDKEGDEEADEESFEDEIANRTDENHAPVAHEDLFGARYQRATVLPVLDNDSDPDGDVLTIVAVTPIDEGVGTMALVDGGRALQFTSAPGATGAISARYTVSDGRSGGVADAVVTVNATPDSVNTPPSQKRVTSVSVEQGQTISYNVLPDWADPDGDELFLKSATSASGDTIRRTPDGLVNFTHTTTELGQKVIDVVVSDGVLDTPGTLVFTVREAGTLAPVGTPDFATTFIDQPVTITPLDNDRSPSGQPLSLVNVQPFDPDLPLPAVSAAGEVTFAAPRAGTFYLTYTVAAGTLTSVGLVRVDVVEDPGNPLPPIAVRDVAYLRPSQSIDLGVLQNDVSPSGRVIGIQSVDLDISNTSVTVEVLKNRLLRISASEALAASGSFSFRYTVSDGVNQATATVVVVPVPPLASNQPPIAKDDAVTVRAGDVVSVPVLDNDVHPDGALMHVSPDFSVPLGDDQGFAFVSDNEVRYQAPEEAGSYQLSYGVYDDFEQRTSATIVFTVVALDAKSNQAPLPHNLEASVFAGTAFRVDVPLNGIDPDGDSTSLVDISSSPVSGRIIEQGEDWFRYEAYADSLGTDEFSYQVVDAFGAIGQGLIHIGVIAQPTDALPPSAVNDPVSLRPDRSGTVAVLGNDSDPSGFALSLDDELVIPDGIDARVVDSQVVIEAENEGLFTIQYSVSNGHGGTDTGYLIVTVDENAPLLPPIAIDHVVEIEEAAGKSVVEIDALQGAQNPSGLVAELEVGLAGPTASFATVNDDRSVSVALGDTRRVVAYTVTSADGLTATAFLFVPRKVSASFAPPPYLKPDLAEQTVDSGATRTWNLSDILVVPSGGTATLVGADLVTASKSNGESPYVDENTITFTSAPDYSGPASLTFLVTDGPTADDSDGNAGYVTLPITVTGGEPDVPPTFTAQTIQVEVVKSTSLDLRAATDHPSPQVKSRLQYDQLEGMTSNISASISGSTLTVSAASGSTGSTARLKFRISGGGVDEIVATVNVVVVPSSAPLAQVQDDVVLTQRPNTETVSPLVNDGNPFGAGKPLTIVSAVIEDNGAPGATVSHTASTVKLVPAPGFIGTFSVLYTVMDDTGDASRNVSARIQFVYRDRPGNTPATPGVLTPGDRQITVRLNDQPPPNNAAIDKYTITASNGTTMSCTSLPCQVVFTGLTNGTYYSFTAFAHNVIGDGATWNIPPGETPWGTPAPPQAPAIAPNYASVDMYWVNNGGDSAGVTYNRWTLVQGGGDSASVGPSAASATVARRNNGTVQFQVVACNPRYCSAPALSAPATQPRTPTFTVKRGLGATVDSLNDANRVVIVWDESTAIGSYTMCGSASSNVMWWWWTSGSGNCARVGVGADRESQPFGWVVKKGETATLTLSIDMVMPAQSATLPAN